MKLLASLIASVALAITGLAVPSATAAPSSPSPSPSPSPYPGTVATHCDYVVPGSVQKGHNLVASYRVRANGNAKPWGTVTFRVWRIQHGKLHFVRSFTRGYHGNNWRTISLGSFKHTGRYATGMHFYPKKGSVFKGSSSGLRFFNVVKHKHHHHKHHHHKHHHHKHHHKNS